MKVELTYNFRDGGARGNYIDGCPSWLEAMFGDEYSPVRTALQSVEPGTVVTVSVEVRGAEKASAPAEPKLGWHDGEDFAPVESTPKVIALIDELNRLTLKRAVPLAQAAGFHAPDEDALVWLEARDDTVWLRWSRGDHDGEVEVHTAPVSDLKIFDLDDTAFGHLVKSVEAKREKLMAEDRAVQLKRAVAHQEAMERHTLAALKAKYEGAAA
jgi:hypothetical protein